MTQWGGGERIGTGSGSGQLEHFATLNQRDSEQINFWGSRGPLLTWIHMKDHETEYILVSDHGDLPEKHHKEGHKDAVSVDKLIEGNKSPFNLHRVKSPINFILIGE